MRAREQNSNTQKQQQQQQQEQEQEHKRHCATPSCTFLLWTAAYHDFSSSRSFSLRGFPSRTQSHKCTRTPQRPLRFSHRSSTMCDVVPPAHRTWIESSLKNVHNTHFEYISNTFPEKWHHCLVLPNLDFSFRCMQLLPRPFSGQEAPRPCRSLAWREKEVYLGLSWAILGYLGAHDASLFFFEGEILKRRIWASERQKSSQSYGPEGGKLNAFHKLSRGLRDCR